MWQQQNENVMIAKDLHISVVYSYQTCCVYCLIIRLFWQYLKYWPTWLTEFQRKHLNATHVVQLDQSYIKS